MVCCVYCDCLSHWDLGSKPNVGNSKLFSVYVLTHAHVLSAIIGWYEIHYEYIYYVAILHFDGQIFIALLYENLGHSLSDARIVLFLWDVEIEGVKDLEKGSVEFQQIQFNDRDGLLPLIVNTGCQLYILVRFLVLGLKGLLDY